MKNYGNSNCCIMRIEESRICFRKIKDLSANKNLSKPFMSIICALYVGFGAEHVKNCFLLSKSCNLFTLARDLFWNQFIKDS